VKEEILKVEDLTVVIFYHNEDTAFVNEAKTRGNHLIGNYSYLKHPPHTSPGDYHLHVYDGNNEIFAINKNGTAHDGYHGVRIPNKVHNALKQKFTNWTFPADKIIESFNYTYFLNDISELNYREVLNELDFISSEMNLFDKYEKLPKSLLTERYEVIKPNHERLTERFQKLFIESYNRIK
jgi:hypothetical protein